jgi:hypothetical protein
VAISDLASGLSLKLAGDVGVNGFCRNEARLPDDESATLERPFGQEPERQIPRDAIFLPEFIWAVKSLAALIRRITNQPSSPSLAIH